MTGHPRPSRRWPNSFRYGFSWGLRRALNQRSRVKPSRYLKGAVMIDRLAMRKPTGTRRAAITRTRNWTRGRANANAVRSGATTTTRSALTPIARPPSNAATRSHCCSPPFMCRKLMVHAPQYQKSAAASTVAKCPIVTRYGLTARSAAPSNPASSPRASDPSQHVSATRSDAGVGRVEAGGQPR